MSATEFRKELEGLINRHSMENGSNTPDFILAEYLGGCLETFDRILRKRDEWYGRKPTIAELETMLNEEGPNVRINPDGTVSSA